MSPKILLAVAFGGAVGAVGRYLVMSAAGHWIGHGYPYGTLIVNVIGSFALGAVVETSALVWSPSPEVRAMVTIGLLGAFTTFSTFSMDAVFLFQRGSLALSAGYVAASVVLSIGAFIGGMAALRHVLT